MAFEEHMMYKGKESEKAETNQEHLKLKKIGWGHKKGPFKMKSPLYKAGMWSNIHAKRKRGDKSTDDRPSAAAWAENTK